MVKDNCCQKCGRDADHLEEFTTRKGKLVKNYLAGHHVFPKEYFGKKDNNTIATLCNSCHIKLHSTLIHALRKDIRRIGINTICQLFGYYGLDYMVKYFRKFTNDFIKKGK